MKDAAKILQEILKVIRTATAKMVVRNAQFDCEQKND